VIAAADAVVLDVAVVERRAAMLAELLDAADAAAPSRKTSRFSPMRRIRFLGFVAVISAAGQSGCQ
jgi:hypothetical protein